MSTATTLPRMTPAQQALAAEHLRYARLVARGWQARHPHLRDEIESEAIWALMVAAGEYRPGPASFATCLRREVVWALKMLIRSESRRAVRDRRARGAA